MNQMTNPLRNEQGQIMVIALVILVLLTLMGISITTTSDIDIQIAKNEQQYVRDFYVADSAWRLGVQWLDTRPTAPQVINKTLFITNSTASNALNVKNYGITQQAGLFNDTFLTGTQDGALNTGSNQINYWYRVEYLDEGISMTGTQALSFGKGFRSYNFKVTGKAKGTNQVNPTTVVVTVSKVYQVGE